ncbi:hypothetical protein [Streptomyces sp. NPDC001980]|uniref:hypothetical protein n=1 Tax=Streptomyces sp. NPDC001980 TaxID=3157126 RepID=UPI00331D8E9D
MTLATPGTASLFVGRTADAARPDVREFLRDALDNPISALLVSAGMSRQVQERVRWTGYCCCARMPERTSGTDEEYGQ